VLGHEICGIDEKTGRRYALWPGKACGRCGQCRTGSENLCSSMRITGFHTDGGFAEYVLAPVSSLIPVPYRISDGIACLAEPLACAINALDQAGVENDQSILIYGAGPLGLLMGMAAAWRGADPYITETSAEKFIKSEDFRAKIGIGTAVSSTSGFDAAINAAPFAETFMEGLTRLKYGGNFCLFSG
ncbi:MAG: alcohol dehydrogenase catalytic domain-containing protein, partial [Proteobacteria bacterium]|nr:alcohol dehydrogenase catalytic domain-containing protein [Pseudomonadota bacterium]